MGESHFAAYGTADGAIAVTLQLSKNARVLLCVLSCACGQ